MNFTITINKPRRPKRSPFLVTSSMTNLGLAIQPIKIQVPIATTGMRMLLLA